MHPAPQRVGLVSATFAAAALAATLAAGVARAGPLDNWGLWPKVDPTVTQAILGLCPTQKACDQKDPSTGHPFREDTLQLWISGSDLHKVGAKNHIMNEEVFGPVLAVTPFRDEDEVTRLANATRFGLAAGVWTRDLRRAHTMARRLQAGTVWINIYRALTFNSPFGGYKSSGLGRANGMESVDQYLQTKSVWVELGDEVQDPFVLKT